MVKRTQLIKLARERSLGRKMLRQAPELEAKALFEHPAQDVGQKERIHPGLLRTFQRRVRGWRLKEGAESSTTSYSMRCCRIRIGSGR